MTKHFDQQVVWITGASSGIGAYLAQEFYKEGAIVCLSARREDRLQTLIKDLGTNARAYPLDVCHMGDTKKTAQQIVDDFGKIDVVIANAGYGVHASFEKTTEEMWRKLYETNVFGLIWTLQAALPFIKKTKGRVGVVSSVAGKLAFAHSSAYCSTKAAVSAIANSIYQELYKDGVSVTNIAPGLVKSEIFQVNNLGEHQGQAKAHPLEKYRMATDKAAQIIVNALYKRKRDITFPSHGKLAAMLAAHTPSLAYSLLARSGRSRGLRSES